MLISEKELKAVRFYEGDVEGSDPFWSDPKAYVTINSLFYEGINTEIKRTSEGKKLNPAILADTDRLFEVLRDLLKATEHTDLSRERHSFRVERYADYLEMKKHGGTVSFTSTSTDGFLSAYSDRHGIALMCFTIPEKIPCFPYEETLGDLYFKKDEHEILLPPGLSIEFREVELSDEDRQIRDDHNEPPLLKCEAVIKGRINYSSGTEMKDGIKDVSSRLYAKLNEGIQLSESDEADIAFYSEWKKAFVSRLMNSLNPE